MLLGQVHHDLPQTLEVAVRLLGRGVDPSAPDAKGNTPTHLLVRMKPADDELRPLVVVWLDRPGLDVERPNAFGMSAIDAARGRPYRAETAQRLESYAESAGFGREV